MNVNILTVNISGGDMDVIILSNWAVFDKCFTSELHIMEQKPLRPQHTHTHIHTPAPPDQRPQEEKNNSPKRPDWLQCFCSCVDYSTC